MKRWFFTPRMNVFDVIGLAAWSVLATNGHWVAAGVGILIWSAISVWAEKRWAS